MDALITILSIMFYIGAWLGASRLVYTHVIQLPGDDTDYGDAAIALFLGLMWPVAIAVSPIVGIGWSAAYLITAPERKRDRKVAMTKKTANLERAIYGKPMTRDPRNGYTEEDPRW